MKIQKAAAVPLILQDPFTSIWSNVDHLYDSDPIHWSGNRQTLRGYVKVDDTLYSFLGDRGHHCSINQTEVAVTATATEYTFENEKVLLKLRFTSPLLLSEPVLVSRPCTYVDFDVQKKTECQVEILFDVYSDVVSQRQDSMIGGNFEKTGFRYGFMGRTMQQPLSGSGDDVTIDWGYVYLASEQEGAKISFSPVHKKLTLELPVTESQQKTDFIFAYDDLLSINYFGEWKKAYWTSFYPTILDAIGAAFADKEEVIGKAKQLDEEIYNKALTIGGEKYAYICNLSYRHAIAAHKLISDENGNLIFLSKENDSNGCVGTVDVTYPSVPLFLLYDTEYVKAMLRPVFRFAACDVWSADYAPHDVGRYPYAWGQVYGLNEAYQQMGYGWRDRNTYPPVYMYPAESNIYQNHMQMPVEECGNMLILTAVVSLMEGNIDFANPYLGVLEQWSRYLLEYGEDPGEQLCTDDFAGHLAHNVNLSAKAIMGIEAYALIMKLCKDQEAYSKYHEKAKQMAASWEARANAGDHYMLSFGETDTWSLKYNLVWDKLFKSNLFSDKVYEKELKWYVSKINEYGVPLDSRRDYTKSDWILWCATMTEDKEEFEKLVAPVAKYLEQTETRVPFSDWYDTVTGKYCLFKARSVQGGLFMPMLKELL
ncbi:MAG: DUF4965 domain-containing protein [Tyzzerella sp.]|nr:DUF4965 domain-containing protein [Tyzzerella sp.]